MKRNLIYCIGLFVCLSFLYSCKDEIDDGGDVTPPDELADVKAIFEAKTFEGDTSTVFTMGERVTFFDLSEGLPDERTWSLPEKFCLISATSSAAALTRQPIGAVCADADMHWLLETAVAETAAVARAQGVALPDRNNFV